MLGEFEESDAQWVLDAGAEQQVKPGTAIIREGGHPSALYFVQKGLLGVTVASAGDRQLAVLGPGELVGEISFLEDEPATATVAAVENASLWAVPRTVLKEKLRTDAAFASRFYKSLALISSRRLRQRVTSLAAQLRAKEGGVRGATDRFIQVEGVVDAFKGKLEKADGEAIKRSGRIPEALAAEIRRDFRLMTLGINREIGPSSPLDLHVKDEFGAHLKTELLPYLLLTQTAERFYSKPRGYAGDYLTIEWIYRNQPAGSGRLGPLLDACFLDAAAARAVRNRRGLLADEIRRTVDETSQREVQIASLACGPAREVFDVLEAADDIDRLRFTLLDFDEEALGFVTDRAQEHSCRHRIHTVSANLIYLALGRQQLELPPQHLVYSIGLIDYFEDRLVLRLIDYVHGLLRPGGRVLLGNFHPDNCDRAFMDHILEWKLIHRTEDDMNRLFEASKFGRPCTQFRFEEEGVNLFAECVKQSN
jgi:CRP-like cAMP-binding protein